MEKQEKIKGIILGVVKYSDTHSIATLYTPTHGRLPVMVRTGGSSSASRSVRARLQPLMQIEGLVSIKSGREIQKLGKFGLLSITPNLLYDPIKRVTLTFIADFLSRLLRESSPDENLWNYLSGAILAFDRMSRGTANFHIALLSSLTYFVGIAPDLSRYEEGSIFDMREGIYSSILPSHSDILSGEEAKVPLWLSKLDIVNCRGLRLTGAMRSELLEGVLRYYSIHFPGIENLRSTDVLRSLFR